MSGRKRPSTGLRDHTKSCIRAIIKDCACGIEQLYPSWRRIRHNSTAASGSTARVPEAAAPGAPEFEYEQGMQANPTEVFQGGDDARTETTHAHSSRICASPTPAHVHARTPARAHIHAHKPVCTDAHTCKHARIHACMYEPQHARKCIRTCMHPCMHTTISKHAHTHVCAHVSLHTHTHT